MKYSKNLDSLRGIAAVTVIFFHYRNFIPFGWVGVELFFVLSGYLITSILLEQKELVIANGQGIAFYYVNFLTRRMRRLLPLYCLLVFGCLVVYYFIGRADIIKAWPYLMTYTVNFGKMQSGFNSTWGYGHTWSLGVQWQFYVIWPLVVWLLNKRSLFNLMALLVLASPIGRLITHQFYYTINTVSTPYFAGQVVYNAPWSHLDALCMGGLIAFPSVLNFAVRGVVLKAVGGVLILVAVMHVFYGEWYGLFSFRSLGFPNHLPYAYAYVWGYTVLAVVFTVLVAVCITGARITTKVLDFSFLRYLGKISYGLYVYHAPVIGVVMAMSLFGGSSRFSFISIVGLVLVISVTWALSHFSYYYYEAAFSGRK